MGGSKESSGNRQGWRERAISFHMEGCLEDGNYQRGMQGRAENEMGMAVSRIE
jgi:hypothetical protein